MPGRADLGRGGHRPAGGIPGRRRSLAVRRTVVWLGSRDWVRGGWAAAGPEPIRSPAERDQHGRDERHDMVVIACHDETSLWLGLDGGPSQVGQEANHI